MRTIAPAAILFLAACMPQESPVSLPAGDTCGAAGLQGLVGQPVAQQDFTGIGNMQRIMTDGSAMTMDYHADRLNVTYDSRGRITRIWCG